MTTTFKNVAEINVVRASTDLIGTTLQFTVIFAGRPNVNREHIRNILLGFNNKIIVDGDSVSVYQVENDCVQIVNNEYGLIVPSDKVLTYADTDGFVADIRNRVGDEDVDLIITQSVDYSDQNGDVAKLRTIRIDDGEIFGHMMSLECDSVMAEKHMLLNSLASQLDGSIFCNEDDVSVEEETDGKQVYVRSGNVVLRTSWVSDTSDRIREGKEKATMPDIARDIFNLVEDNLVGLDDCVLKITYGFDRTYEFEV